jgi:4-hydroxy-tetrahydrodipicolinate reductase
MDRIRAVIYGVGTMGSVATRFMLEKGVDIVGALARSPAKVGKDVGEVAGLDVPVGVVVENDPEKVLSERSPDIAVVCIASYMSDMYEHLRRCAATGVNAITISEESLYPWNTSPARTAELDGVAKANGVTITGSGHQDVYWVNIVSLVMGTAHRIDVVRGRASWNVDDYGPEVAKDQHVGDTTAEFEEFLRTADRPPTFGRNTLGALIADVGLTPKSYQTTSRAEIADEDMRSASLDETVPRGGVIGFTDIDTVETVEGPLFEFEMIGRLYKPGEADINEWSIEGEPELHQSNPRVPTGVTTCTQLVNRIPDVINAPPGFVTIEKLPKLRYRSFPLHQYVNR